MRAFIAAFLVIAVLLAVSIDAKKSSKLSGGLALQAAKLSKAFGKALKHHGGVSKALKVQGGFNTRRFSAQQAVPTIPCSASGFQNTFLDVMSACSSSGEFSLPDMDNIDPSNASYIAQLDGFCASDKCGGKLAVVASNAAYMKCLTDFSSEFALMPVMVSVLCSKEDNKYCIASLGQLGEGDSCDAWAQNATDCTSRNAVCVWSAKESRCSSNITKTVEAACSSTSRKCITRLADVLKNVPELQDGPADLVEMFDITCHQFNGRYCAPIIAEFGNMGLNGGEEDIGFICNDRLSYGCLSSIAPKVNQQAVREARKSFYQCIEWGNNETWYVDQYCKPSYMYATQGTNALETSLGLVCSRNAKGAWCATVMDKYESLGERCVFPVYQNSTSGGSGVCSAKCSADLSAALDDMGCCVGTMIAMEKSSNPSNISYPPYTPSNRTTEVKAEAKARAMKAMQVVKGETPVESVPVPESGSNNNGNNNEVTLEALIGGLRICSSIGSAKANATVSTTCPRITDVTTIDPCYGAEFRAMRKEMETQCEAVDVETVLFGEYSSDAAANAGFAAFCNSSCAMAATRIMARFQRCVNPETASQIRSALVMCEKAPNGDFCGVQARSFGELNCNEKGETQCKASSQCTWITSSKNSHCDIQPTTAMLEKLCSPCLSKIANALGESNDGREALSFQQFMCARADNQFCFPLVISELRATDDFGFSNETLISVCGNSTKDKCVSAMLLGTASMTRGTAESQYRSCLNNAENQNTANRCAQDFADRMREVNKEVSQVDSLCLKNANGDYCMSLLRTAAAHPCISSIMSSGSCSTDCDAQVQTLVNNFGCCAGNLHQQVRDGTLSASDLPVVRDARFQPTVATQATTQDPTVAAGEVYIRNIGNTTDRKNGLFLLLACSSQQSTLSTKLHIGCDTVRSARIIEKSKTLPIAYDKLKEDPVAEERLRTAMCKDVATAMNRKPSEVQDCRFEKDTTTTVKTAARRMAALEDFAGTKFLFKIQTTSDADTTAAAAQFDTLVATNQLVLPTASTVVADCGCMDTTATSLAVEAAPVIAPEPADPVTPSTPDSASASVSALVAIVAVIAAALLL